ncbi:AraC family transcriptional regulator [Providencia huaxiensis]|nr:AraC family transcriptional regulator [Providencia huaxiensis]
MMLKQYYPPDELKSFVSSILIIKEFTEAIKIFPGTGAEIWVSSDTFQMTTESNSVVDPYQLIIPRVNTFTASPNDSKVMVLRIRHDALRFLLPQRTLNYTDEPIALNDIWKDRWFEALANSSFKELLDCFNRTKAKKKSHFTDEILELLYRNPTKKITEIAEETGLHLRVIQKEFLKEYGITPKKIPDQLPLRARFKKYGSRTRYLPLV